MKTDLLRSFLAFVLALGALAVCSQASAQAYPTKPVSLVVPYAAGGASDVIARLLGRHLSDTLRQPVVVENKPGADGMIAAAHVAKAPADGHTLLFANIGPNAMNASLYRKMTYDPVKDFAPVARTNVQPMLLVASPTSSLTSLADLVAKAKEKPGSLTFASSGPPGQFAMEMFKANAGIDVTMVPYKGDAPALQDVLAGHVELMFPSAIAAAPHLQSAKLKVFAVTSARRLPSLPNVPTIAELGMPGFEAVNWGGVVAPAGTPRQVVDRLSTEINRILKLPEVREKIAQLGAEPAGTTSDEFGAYIQAEIAKWARVAKAAKIDPQ